MTTHQGPSPSSIAATVALLLAIGGGGAAIATGGWPHDFLGSTPTGHGSGQPDQLR